MKQVEEVKARLKLLSADQMENAGVVHRARSSGYVCPFCRDGTGSDGTGMNTKSLPDRQSWFCGKCGMAYDNLDLLAAHFGKDIKRDFNEVIQLSASLFNICLADPVNPPVFQKPAVPDKYKKFILNANSRLKSFLDNHGGFWRGLSFDTLNRYLCGVSDCHGLKDEPQLPHFIIPSSFNHCLVRLIGKPDDYPAANDLNIKTKPHWGSKELFGLKPALNDDNTIFLVEGEFDAMSIWQASHFNAIAISGSALPEPMRNQLKNIPPKNFIVLLDNDKTGKDKSQLIVNALKFIGHNAISFILSDLHKDANDFLQADPDALKSRLQEIYSQAQIQFNVDCSINKSIDDWQAVHGNINPDVLIKLKDAKAFLDGLNQFNITAAIAQSPTTKYSIALCKFYDCFADSADKFYVKLNAAKQQAAAAIKQMHDEGGDFVAPPSIELQALLEVSVRDIKANINPLVSKISKAHKQFLKDEAARKNRELLEQQRAEQEAVRLGSKALLEELETLPPSKERDEKIIQCINDMCSWKHDKLGNPVKVDDTLENLSLILEHDPCLKNLFGFEEFQNTHVLLKKPTWRKKNCTNEEWTDFDDSELRMYIRKNYREFANKDLLYDAFIHYGNRNAFNVGQQYFENLPQWDGVPRAEQLFIKFLKVEDTPFHRAATMNWLTAAVARMFHPGCNYQSCLVLPGNQGIGKSYLLQRLGGQFYKAITDRVDDPHAADTIKLVWIGEFKEMAGMRKAEVNAIKAFIELNEDTRRFAYQRRACSVPRHCVFVITVNDDQFLADKTGNRRYLILRCNLDQGKYVEGLTDQFIQQLWAEVYFKYNELFKDGFDEKKLELSYDFRMQAEEITKRYTVDDGLEGEIKSFLDNDKIPPAPIWNLLTKDEQLNAHKNGFVTLLDCETDLNKRARARYGDKAQKYVNELYTLFHSNSLVIRKTAVKRGDELLDEYHIYGSEQRNIICAAQISNELFGVSNRRLMIRINEVLARLDGWEHSDRQMHIQGYGKQKNVYIRCDCSSVAA